jgi:hypothetical protein
MTAYERAVLDRLLSAEFPGREAALIQAKTARVQSIDDDGCFDFHAPDGPDIDCEYFVLSEGLGPTDSYDTPILLTLFQRKGRLGGVEFTRFDGDPNYFPDPREWTVGPFEFIP